MNRSATNRVSYTLDSTLESVNRAEKTAVDIADGNAYDPLKKFVVAYEVTSDALIITITDQGQGLDPEKIPDPLSPDNLLKNSGRGIFLIRAFMDEVTIRNLNPGTEIRLVKNIGRQAPNAKEETQ